jgi:predicted MFS family arabinose efflux permease
LRYMVFRVLSLYRKAFSNLQANIWILSFATVINRSGAMVLVFTSLYLTKELNFSIANAGVIMSFFGMGSVLGAYTGGWLTDRRSFFDIMIFSLLGSGSILLLFPFVSSQVALSAIVFLYAFMSDMFRPANAAAIAAYSTPETRTRSVSLVRLAINVGFSLGPAGGGFVALYLGYKWLYVIDAFTSIAAATILFFYLPRQEKKVSTQHNEVLANKKTSAYRDTHYLVFIFLVALFGTCFFQLFASVPQYFSVQQHYSEDTIGLLLALNGVLVVVIEMPFITWLEARLRGQSRKKMFSFIIAGNLCLPVAFGILDVGGSFIVCAIMYTLMITMAEILAMPFMMNYSLSRPRKERQGQYSALYSISYGIANIIAPSLGLGIAGAFGFEKMFYFFIFLGIVTALGFVWLKKREVV